MKFKFIPIENYQTKFYQKERNSKRFLELSEEQLSVVGKKVYSAQEKSKDTLYYHSERMSKLDRYQRTMQYLTSQYIHLEFKTFDERIAYLIMMVDPELVMFKEFLKIDLISKSEIDRTYDKDERDCLKAKRNQTMAKYETTVRDKIGFFDIKLLKYEEFFFNRFFSEKELITEVGNNNHDILILKAKFLKNFDSISDERYEELIDKAQTWLSFIPEKDNFKVASYSVINQKKLLHLTNTAEQLALFILLVDSNLDMLRIYEEECMMKDVEERIKEQFGYFDKDLLVLERKFHARFCPDKKLSAWTMTKQD